MKPLFRSVRLGSMAAPRALWLTALFAALARTVHAAGPVVRCEPCDADALGQCKPLPRDCAERVREPGCGCCLTCALSEGQACGVYTGRCGAGLRCQHRPGESKPLQALLEGRGVCSRATDRKLRVEEPVEEHLPTTTIATVSKGTEVVQDTATGSGVEEGMQRTELDTKKSLLHTKLSMIQMAKFKQGQIYKVEPVAKGVHPDIHNFSLESKRETEYGPCRIEMESVLKSLRISSVINFRVFRIPNCDRKGFYKKKQCRPSKGHKRGQCWCVDKYGQPLPGYEGKEQSQVHCYNQENK
ncbi:insulin-like growth factor-binding protein 3 isoform X1 [Ictalurus furcatus]|uniref:insulin-like growth factor-binding protein 3 isoform X1 n=1 Tax=Ictalurus furcatus TaxID=66913 RepID=UPI00234FC043|nr:insulin-like growth factor-binding protein 3 isoform X1 [Ictalurus furcatus]